MEKNIEAVIFLRTIHTHTYLDPPSSLYIPQIPTLRDHIPCLSVRGGSWDIYIRIYMSKYLACCKELNLAVMTRKPRHFYTSGVRNFTRVP